MSGRPAKTNRRRLILAALAGPLLVGCATSTPFPEPEPALAECLQWYAESDRAITHAGQGDASAARVQAHPYLRSNRFLASYAEAPMPAASWRWWIEAMAALDRRLRQLELRRLPARARQALQPERLEPCSRLLTAASLALSPDQRSRLRAQVRVPDHYITWQQLLGLYPIPALIARSQIGALHAELAAPFELAPGRLDYRGERVDYNPDLRPYSPPIDIDVVQMPPQSDWPSLDREQVHALLHRHAPALALDQRNHNDRIGAIELDDQRRPAVDVTAPIAYSYLSRGRFGEEVLLQLNYVFWFPARDTDDIYGGHLDALIWRVHLDRRSRPLAYDSIHACGCYYKIFPGPGFEAGPTPPGAEPVLALGPAPALQAGQRLRLYLSAATHYLRQIEPIDAADSDPATRRYRLTDYDRLLQLPDRRGGQRSLFDRHGLVPSSARGERYLFWPLGVRSAGAMRQSGTHAIAFVGRRHFDDPRLIEQLIRERP